jgi:hypothetical protein
MRDNGGEQLVYGWIVFPRHVEDGFGIPYPDLCIESAGREAFPIRMDRERKDGPRQPGLVLFPGGSASADTGCGGKLYTLMDDPVRASVAHVDGAHRQSARRQTDRLGNVGLFGAQNGPNRWRDCSDCGFCKWEMDAWHSNALGAMYVRDQVAWKLGIC